MARRSRLLIAATIIGCNGAAIVPGIDASSTDASDESQLSFDDGAYHPDVSYISGQPDALPPPQFDCLDAGSVAARCPPPPSICASSGWLEYFDDGVCVDGGCQFAAHVYECAYVCYEGGCGGGPSHTNAP